MTERELQQGILDSSSPSKHCLWFKRVITDMANVAATKQHRLIPKFYDTKGETRKMFDELAEVKLKAKLPQDCIEEFKVEWADEGGRGFVLHMIWAEMGHSVHF